MRSLCRARWRSASVLLHRLLFFALAAVFLVTAGSPGWAQRAVPVVLLSDLHFDPFTNPAAMPRLLAAPVEQWPDLLRTSAAGSPSPQAAALQTACPASGPDTAWPLLRSSITAAQHAQPRPAFVAVAGDLLVHGFPCRIAFLLPGSTPTQRAAFAAKVVDFVLQQLRAAFPGVPVYAALGNNDAPCGDYRETPGDPFLEQARVAIAAAGRFPLSEVMPTGDYSVALPASIDRGRLIVLEDVFSGRSFARCDGKADPEIARSQLQWLRVQLDAARRSGEHVWFMTHMPTGVDVYNSFKGYLLRPAALCEARPRSFLANQDLANLLLNYSDVVRLAVFGHTHMDELRVLHRDAAAPGERGATIPAKIVPSISPFAGNHPAFLTAEVDRRTAVLVDWRTWISPALQGSAAPWVEGYRFRSAYEMPDFGPDSALALSESLKADQKGQAAPSVTYRQHFFPGDLGLYALGLVQLWPAYACSVAHTEAPAVQQCICAAAPPSEPAGGAKP